MESLLLVIPALPLAGAIILALFGRRFSREVAGWLGTGTMGLAALLSFRVLYDLIDTVGGTAITTTLYTWIEVGGFTADVGFLADPLSASFMCIITGVGFLIHLYSIGYMSDESDRQSVWRFFSYLNLFVFAMLLLVMGDNLVLMFVGWEGVGLCSYLLIGFWYENAEFASAGKKAFVTNRIGDFCFILGAFWLFWALGSHATLDFQHLAQVVEMYPALLPAGGVAITGICLLFFGGVTGKSAQWPLFVWLPDAMAGPTPVSALIHAATMVTAGVYLICRLHFLFVLSPMAMGVVALTGAFTAFFAASIALTQFDIKKVLAYSTVSQLGYMVMAVGLGHFTAGFFHVMTHSFFKALLFLGAGSIIHALHHQQDMRKMGGLRKYMPVTFWCMTAAYVAIIGVPGTSGFFSKDEILWLAWVTPVEHVAILGENLRVQRICFGLGFLAAGMTAYYMTRMYLMTFFGEYRGGHGDTDGHEPHESSWLITLPLVILAVLSLFGGLLNLPHWLPGAEKLHHFLHPVFASSQARLAFTPNFDQEFGVAAATFIWVFACAAAAYKAYAHAPASAPDPHAVNPTRTWELSHGKWFVDEIYEALILKPIHFISRQGLWGVVDVVFIDGTVNLVGRTARNLGRHYGRLIQNGQIQTYALAICGGAVAILFWFMTV
jgi:NADH-quinone oxidoreductase subunit L